ncbi:Carnosine N-methyltransferase like protein [Verticillium longisporum]|nr:Carnosine N-methyltransferase like protein [Verticillium longisporum]
MKFSSPGLVVLALLGYTSGFVMNIYEHDDCQGKMQEVNIWDNTCASWIIPFNSVMLIKDGTWKQKARFCPGKACLMGCQKAWAVVSTVANLTWLDCKFTFKTRYPTASCLGKLMMLPEKLSDGQLHWKIWTMATLLTAFGDFPEDVRLLKEPSSVIGSSTVLSTDVVIVGGGNAGLIQAARLKALNVDFVVIEKNPQTGDNWAKRYDYMRFHIGKNYCQMPYLPYPEEAEYELPRDELQRHIQRFAREFDLGPRVLNNSKVKETSYDEKAQTWKLNLIVEGVQKSITCRALIIATGSGFSTPFVPEVADRGAFKGPSLHSSSFRSGKELLEHGAKSVIIIGSANSAFDVSEDCHNAGLTVQMIQRSPTYVIPMRYYAHPQGLGVFDVVSTEVADAMINMGPVAIGGQLPGLVHAAMAAEEPDRYSELNDAGFKAVDSTKEDLIDHLHSRAGGFVVDMGTGGVDLIVSGTAKVRSGVTPVSYTSTGLRLSDGTLMEALPILVMRLSATIPLAVLACAKATLAAEDVAKGDTAIDIHEDLAAVTIESLLEVHEVIVTLTEEIKPSPRYEAEHNALLKRMSKSHGKWDTTHPRARLLDALHGYVRYRERQTAELDKWRRMYKSTSSSQKKVVEHAVGYTKKMDTVASLIEQNHVLCQQVVDGALEFYGVERDEMTRYIEAKEKENKAAERVSVSQALKHYVRDWTVSGLRERDAAFPCIIQSLEQYFPDRSQGDVKVLLPGAGVGRLGHEVAALGGFEVTTNEWSMYMNLAYRFLEKHPRVGSNNVHPFIDGWSHHASTADMFRGVAFPDRPVNTSAVVLVEGDFTTAFKGQNGHFDALVTHFFIDTARNLMSYFETIHGLLRKGGIWVNLGPLLYGTGPYVQLSLDEIIAVVNAMGFEFVDAPESCGELTFADEKVRGREAVYGFNERALVKNAYNAQSWVMRKK